MNEIYPIKQSEIEISHSVESYDKKNYRKLQKFPRFWKAHNIQTVKDIYLSFG